MSDKLYRNFDENEIMDSDWHFKHVHAMTGESLHSKMDIAAELAFRDIQIEKLTAECDELSSRLYDVQWFFCDEDGTPIIENLTIANLEKWLAKRDLEREAIGVNKYLTELARVFNHSEKSPTQVFGRRYSKELIKQAEDLTNDLTND